VIVVVAAISTVIVFTVARLTEVNSETGSSNPSSSSRAGGRSNHCANHSKRDKESGDQHELSNPVYFLELNTRRYAVVPKGRPAFQTIAVWKGWQRGGWNPLGLRLLSGVG
jgi:hypothetical protein